MRIRELPSPNQDRSASRTMPIDMLILHYTGMQTAQDGDRPAARSGGAGVLALCGG